MKMLRDISSASLATAFLFAAVGCGPVKKAHVTEIERKEAAHYASEAQFALTLRDYPRAEASLARATALVQDDGRLWVNLGVVRVRLGNRDGAKRAYESALKAYEAEFHNQLSQTDPEPLLREAYVLALLGRKADALKLVNKAAALFPDHRSVKRFIEEKELERLVGDPSFKEMAL